MTDPVRMLELAGDLLKSRRGDQDARSRALRNGTLMAADLVRPGAGRLLERGLDAIRDIAAEEGWHLPGALVDDGPLALPNYEPFVERLVSTEYGFYTVMGEPGTGKTTLALRLAQRIAEELDYRVASVGGLHPDDRRKWSTDEWIDVEPPSAFLEAMESVAGGMVRKRARSYPKAITRRVILLDDAVMTAHISAKRFNQALVQAWSIYRHVEWVLIVTARQFKALTTLAENADARFLKRPDWQQLTSERDHARQWWREADQAFRELRRSSDWADRPRERDWIYVQAPRFRFTGVMPYGPPSPPTTKLPPPPVVLLEGEL